MLATLPVSIVRIRWISMKFVETNINLGRVANWYQNNTPPVHWHARCLVDIIIIILNLNSSIIRAITFYCILWYNIPYSVYYVVPRAYRLHACKIDLGLYISPWGHLYKAVNAKGHAHTSPVLNICITISTPSK